MADQHRSKSYRGNCHCTAYIFEISLPEAIKTGFLCNCSYCYKRGGIFQFPENESEIRFVKGNRATLSSYSFGGVEHQFCSICCTYLFRVDTKTYVNLRALQKVNVWDLATQPIDGTTPPTWTPPGFKGQEPPAKLEGAKIYTGGCHCGVITIAIKSKPIDSTYDGVILECDCSICSRNAYCWIYPSKPQVSIFVAASDGAGYYSFGGGLWRKSFCRVCGVPVHNRIEDYDAAQLAALPDDQRRWAEDHLDWSPVNLRVLDGVDMAQLRIKRVDGSARSGPPKPGGYIDP